MNENLIIDENITEDEAMSLDSFRSNFNDTYNSMSIPNNRPILTIKNNGEIIWSSPSGEININNDRLLGIALMDMINHSCFRNYDLSLLDREIFERYQNFLNSGSFH